MKYREILAGAPEGATHIDAAYNYYVNDACDWDFIDAGKGNALIYQDTSISNFESIRSLTDIQRIVDLEDENAELKRKLEALQPKPKCINCDEPEVIENHCKCCGWLKEEGRYEG